MLPLLCRGGSYMEMIKEMSIDLETYSDVDIKKVVHTVMWNHRSLKYYYLQCP